LTPSITCTIHVLVSLLINTVSKSFVIIMFGRTGVVKRTDVILAPVSFGEF
jgi:hypothetical protein